ncbi:unnamed protein product, partial [Mesorhabditis belari]|uniref:Gustatory receptor n=1 Tax=Mesorhabditis belari TaxID=2138241 RepID=A0AAF3ERE5_9BILA
MIPRLIRHFLEQLDFISPTTFGVLTLLNDIGTACSLQLTMCYAIERLVAMRNWEHYHQRFTTNRLTKMLMAIMMSLTSIEVLGYHVNILSSQLVFGAVYVNYSLASLFFIELHRICRRVYIRVYELKNCTVEERYRTVMNIRASRLLLFLAPYKCLTSVVLYINYCFWVDGEKPQTAIYNCYFVWYAVQIQIFFQMFLTVFAEKSLRRAFLSYFHSPSKAIVSSLGTNMSFSKEEEAKIYFDYIKRSWK